MRVGVRCIDGGLAGVSSPQRCRERLGLIEIVGVEGPQGRLDGVEVGDQTVEFGVGLLGGIRLVAGNRVDRIGLGEDRVGPVVLIQTRCIYWRSRCR